MPALQHKTYCTCANPTGGIAQNTMHVRARVRVRVRVGVKVTVRGYG